MRKKDKNFKIQYKFEDKILSLKFKTVQDFYILIFGRIKILCHLRMIQN